MKKAAAILAVMVMVVSLVSLAVAAEMKGTIKKIDAKAGTVVFSADGGKDETLKADKTVLSTIKEGDKVEAMIEQGALKSVKAAVAPAAAPAAKKKAAVGC